MANFPLAILPRESWCAVPASYTTSLVHPTAYVFCMNTFTGECFSEFECRNNIRRIQETHVNRKFFRDIRFNFIIGGDGNVYEGRGWNNSGFLPEKYKDFNDHALIIGFIGTYSEAELSPLMVKRRNELVNYGIKQKYIDADFKAYEIFTKHENQL